MSNATIRITAQDNTGPAFRSVLDNLLKVQAAAKLFAPTLRAIQEQAVKGPQLRDLLPDIAGQAQAATPRFAEFADVSRAQVDPALFEQIAADVERTSASATVLKDVLSQLAIVQLPTVEFDLLYGSLVQNRVLADELTASLVNVGARASANTMLANDLGSAFAKSADSAITNFKSVSSLLRSLEQDILRVVTRDLITDPLRKSISGAFGGSNGISEVFSKLFSGLSSFDGGGYTGAGPRSGGLDGKGGFLGLLHPREQVVDMFKQPPAATVPVHSLAAAGGRSVVNHITVNVPANTSRQTGVQLTADIARRLEYASSRNN